MIFESTTEFKKDFKKLNRRYKSLTDDIKTFKNVVEFCPEGNTKHFNIIRTKDNIKIIKARFFCKYLKGDSMRVVYALHEDKVIFIQLYHKGDTQVHDAKRVKHYIESAD